MNPESPRHKGWGVCQNNQGQELAAIAIRERLPQRSVLDILCNVEHWLNWTRHFGPISGSEPKLSQPQERYILTTFGYGCNIGPNEMARHVRGKVTSHMLSYTNLRPREDEVYDYIEPLFDEVAEWKLIKTHWQDLMQVVLSIKAGKLLPSTVLRKLGSYSRKNRLYQAFRALGKVIRTMYLLRFISDRSLRREVKLIHIKLA